MAGLDCVNQVILTCAKERDRDQKCFTKNREAQTMLKPLQSKGASLEMNHAVKYQNRKKRSITKYS